MYFLMNSLLTTRPLKKEKKTEALCITHFLLLRGVVINSFNFMHNKKLNQLVDYKQYKHMDMDMG